MGKVDDRNTSSDDNVDEENDTMVRRKDVVKKVGRPVGQPHRAYGMPEMEAGFKVLIDQCPKNISNEQFLTKMMKAMKEVTSHKRTISALQTFVKDKLREAVPEILKRRVGRGKKLSAKEYFFLREYMSRTNYVVPLGAREHADHIPAAVAANDKATPNEAPPDISTTKEAAVHTTSIAQKVARSSGIIKDAVPGSSNAKNLGSTTCNPTSEPPNFVFSFGPVPSTSNPPTELTSFSSNLRTANPFFRPVRRSTPLKPESESREKLKSTIRSIVQEEMGVFRQETLATLKEMTKRNRRDDVKMRIDLKRVKHEESGVELIDLTDDDIDVRIDSDIADSLHKGTDHQTEEEEQHMEINDQQTVQEIQQVEQNSQQTEKEIQQMEQNDQRKEADLQQMELNNRANVGVDNIENDSQRDDDEDDNVMEVTSDRLSREQIASFRAAPLRARLTTLTVLEVHEPTESDDVDSFRALEEGGKLKICHSSLLERGNWSTECTVNHPLTGNSEMNSISRQDLQANNSNGGSPLSPMTVEEIGKKKKVFQMAKLKTGDKVVRVLFKSKRTGNETASTDH